MGSHFRVGVIGFRGYSGSELVRLLARHPGVDVVLLDHRSDAGGKPQPLHALQPRRIECSPEAVRGEQIELVFLATPPEVSAELAPLMLNAGVRVIDLSGEFRLKGDAIYGLPEVHRAKLAGARFISNPGCYPTAANLAIEPLVSAGIIDRRAGVICDAKSGVSGAGRKPSLKTSFCEVTENFSAYAVLDHRHVPEVLMISGLENAEFSFTAQLLPLDRGILETIYFRARGIDNAAALLGIYQRRYQGEPFVRLYAPGEFPDLNSIQRTNFCDIGFKFDPETGRTVVVSAIDNLVKGAAGQAIQNMNLSLGFRETEALL